MLSLHERYRYVLCYAGCRNYLTWVRQLALKAEVFLTNLLVCFQRQNTSVEASSQERNLERGNILTLGICLQK